MKHCAQARIHTFRMRAIICGGGAAESLDNNTSNHFLLLHPDTAFFLTLNAPLPHMRASLMTVVIVCSRARFPPRGSPN